MQSQEASKRQANRRGGRKDPKRKGEAPRARSRWTGLCSEVRERTEESDGRTRDARGDSDTSTQRNLVTESQPGSGDPVSPFQSLHLQGSQSTATLEGLLWSLGAAEARETQDGFWERPSSCTVAQD